MRFSVRIAWRRVCGAALALVLLCSPLLSANGALPIAEAQAPQSQERFTLRFKSRELRPAPGLNVAAVRARHAGRLDERVHFLIQFSDLPDAGARQRLAGLGIRLVAYVSGNAYIASARASDLDAVRNAPGVRWVGPLDPDDKLPSNLRAGVIAQWARAAGGQVALTVQVHQDVGIAEAQALVTRLGGTIVASVPSVPSVTALFSPGQALRLAREDAVQYVDVVDPALVPKNDGIRAAANVTPLAAAPYNLTGAGVTALVYDVGTIDAAHPDFGTRVIQNDGSALSQHATHVAGTLGGSGANSNGNDSNGNPNGGAANQWAGMAPGINMRSFGTTGNANAFYDGGGGDLNADFTTAIGAGIDLATMSLGNNTSTCALLGDYTNTAILVDNIVRGSISNQQLIYLESAGNERGTLGCNQFNSISSPATAKNSIAVGATNSNNNTIAGFSSIGPTDDGRLKPDITAPGCQTTGDMGITSPSFTDSDNDNGDVLETGDVRNTYVVLCGTSMATPAAAGSAALMLQQWRATRGAGARPLPHTVKAILVHTATDRGNAGPDYTFGWGTLNAQAAVDLVRADDTADLINVENVDQGATDFYTFNSDGTANVRVTLAWDDPPATRLAAVTLINDLDLRLVGPDGTVFQPFILNPAAGSEGNAATNGNDNRNNVEMVVGTAAAGTWEVRVAGTAVAQGPQQYTVVTPVDAAADNRRPTANPGGPYTTPEGTNVTLDGGGSTDPDNDTLTFEWDLDNDGAFDDATGPTPTFTNVGRDNVFTIRLRVTDPDGAFDVASTTVTVTNVPPSVTTLTSTAPKPENTAVTVSGVVSDPGWEDPLTATIDWGDGTPVETITGTLENVRPDATLTFNVSHTYGDNGAPLATPTFTATVCARDDDTAAPGVCRQIALGITNVNPTAAIDETGAILVNGVPTFLAQVGQPLTFRGRSQDPGSDDLALSWDWDDGPPAPDVTTNYLVNPPNPDPLPSPSIQPRDVTDTKVHAFADACFYEIVFAARDDDTGTGQDKANVIIVGNAAQVRTAGYWKQAYDRGKDSNQATLNCYLDIVGYMSQVFNEVRNASTIAAALDVLEVNQNGGSVTEHLERQLLAAWLNFANGAIGLTTMVDTDGNGTADTTFANAVAAAEAVRLNPASTRAQLDAQYAILERINTRDG